MPAAEMPRHVTRVRRWAFGVIAVGELVLVGGKPVHGFFGRAWDSMDAGDWVAVGAVIVGVVGLVFARVSATAARSSVGVATRALDIAREAADAASASARAAERSADADSRSADIAEASFHQGRAPKWVMSMDEPGTGGCVVRLRFDEGPNVIRAVAVLSGTAWEPLENGTSEGHVLYKDHAHPCLHPGEPWDIFWATPEGLDIEWVEAVVNIIAVDLDVDENRPPTEPWKASRGVDSPKKVRTRLREIG